MKTHKLNLYFNFLAIFNTKQKLQLLLVAALFLITSVTETIALAIIYPFMSSLLNPSDISGSFWHRMLSHFIQLPSDQAYLSVFSIMLVFLYLMKGAMLLFVNWLKFHILTTIRCEISKDLFAAVMHLPYSVLKHKNSAEIQSILTTDISHIFNAVSALLSVLQQTLLAIAFIVMLLFIDTYLTCRLILLLLFGLLLYRRLTSRQTTSAGRLARKSFISMMQTARESMNSLKQILVCRNQQAYEERFNIYSEMHAKQERRTLFYMTIPKTLFETMIMCTVLLYIWWTVRMGSNFAEKLPILITFALTTVKLIPVVSSVASNFNAIQYTEASAERVLAIMEQCSLRRESKENKVRITAAPLHSGIYVSHLTFRYTDGEMLLRDVSFQIPAQKITGFVGRTGIGKTTLADIILGLYPIEKGSILADGRDIFKEPDWWASHVGYVTQTAMLRDATVRDNIAMGHHGQEPNEERIWECLEEVQMADLIRSLPEGLNTRAGENGIRFSGGQIQRLMIAQALYDDPAFLVLDESTSALDGETEAQVLETLFKLRNRRTILLITHRSSAMKVCDVIYQIENRQIRRLK